MNKETRTWLSGFFCFFLGWYFIDIGKESWQELDYPKSLIQLFCGLVLAINGISKITKTID